MDRIGTIATLLGILAAPVSGQTHTQWHVPLPLTPLPTNTNEQVSPLVLCTTAPPDVDTKTLDELRVAFATNDTIYRLTIQKDPSFWLPGSNNPQLLMAIDSFGALQPGERYHPITADTLAHMRNLGMIDKQYFNLATLFPTTHTINYTGDYSEFCER